MTRGAAGSQLLRRCAWSGGRQLSCRRICSLAQTLCALACPLGPALFVAFNMLPSVLLRCLLHTKHAPCPSLLHLPAPAAPRPLLLGRLLAPPGPSPARRTARRRQWLRLDSRPTRGPTACPPLQASAQAGCTGRRFRPAPGWARRQTGCTVPSGTAAWTPMRCQSTSST